MKNRHALSAIAAFWSMIRCAVLYYILLAMRPLEVAPADRFLYLWMMSPAMVSAAAFFFAYLKPKEYSGALSIGRLSLGLDIAVAAISAGGIAISNLAESGAMFLNNLESFIGLCALISVLAETVLLILTRDSGNQDRNKPQIAEQDPKAKGPEPIATSRPSDSSSEEL